MTPRPTSGASHAFEEHTGEIRLRVDAPALAELFAEAGRALARIACGDRPPPSPDGEAQPVSLRSHDRAALLVDWLNDLIFRTEVEGRVFSEFRFTRLTDRDLDAWIRGARAPEARALVKAATLHDLEITETSHGVSAAIVLDV
ncbi:archease [Sorangium sp. So ce448]|uniref:archease n=1 Tax=Sorangium sp. So ce448 TaxID=3133314 RepID=UPI003F628C9F